MPHIIRLRGPWEFESTDSAVRCTRRFHCPTGLTAESWVWLVIEDVQSAASVSLNGDDCGQIDSSRCPARFDITGRLQPQNLLAITVRSTGKMPAPPEGLLGLVRLEIEESSAEP